MSLESFQDTDGLVRCAGHGGNGICELVLDDEGSALGSLDDLRKRGVPEFIVRWVDSFTSKRSTSLRFNGIDSEKISIEAGVPQGSPISPILYLFYNADLLGVPGKMKSRGRKGTSWGFIDDIAYGIQGGSEEETARKLEEMLREAERWRKKHGARFEPTKYVLVHFTRRRKPPTASITIGNTTIEPSQEARYLGVIFDRKLTFNQHVQHAAKAGTKFSIAISRVAKSTWGISYEQSRMLFKAVAAARMDYAAIVWHHPVGESKNIRPLQLSKLETAQQMAMKATLGAFRTTPKLALEIEATLEPPHLRLREKILRAYTRMQTAPQSHPIEFAIRRAQTSKSKSPVVTTLKYLARTFPQYSQKIETITPFPRPPWWEPKHHIAISSDKDTAKKRHEEAIYNPRTLYIYMDGSGIDGHIGAAAYAPQLGKTQLAYLGTDKQYNVYTAELHAISLAANIAMNAPQTYTACIIYSDSQAAVIATTKPDKQSGQSILCDAIEKLEKLVVEKGMKIDIDWIPGHMSIVGNEMADEAAKKTAKSQGKDVDTTAFLPLKSSRSQFIKRANTNDWNAAWKAGKTTSMHLRKITAQRHVDESAKIYSSITKRQDTARLVCLRTGHCSLNDYLYRFGIEESPMCECNDEIIETVDHFLTRCPRYERERAKLIRNVGVGGMWVDELLGDAEKIRHTLKYISSTGRFTF
jgi:ribonuclease HI